MAAWPGHTDNYDLLLQEQAMWGIPPDAYERSDSEPETLLDRLLILAPLTGERCVVTAAHSHTRRTFDVAGIPICEDCILDIAPVVAQLAAALEEECEDVG